jgi:uncharacterized protein YidB (DUF937 family)
MSRGTPSLVALLGLLAVAGYQNRDKIAEVLAKRKQVPGGGAQDQQSGGMLDKLAGMLGGGSAGTIVSGGLGELIERFKQNGQGPAADSWVSTGPNQPLRAEQLEQAIGPEVLATLSQHTGLSSDELLSRLTLDLPAAVDQFTPGGRLPSEDEAARLI